MRIVGIDPGSRVLGWGVIDALYGSRFTHVASGALRVASEGSLPARLLAIGSQLETILVTHKPEAVSIEDVFYAKNAQSALTLGHARGVAIYVASRLGVPVFEYTALQIKQAVTGAGRAEKDQVQHMIRLLLKLPNTSAMALDTSDALAAAMCHAMR